MKIGRFRSPRQPNRPGLPRPGRGARPGPAGDLIGQRHLHGVLPPAADRSRAHRRPALLPRRAPGRDRGARADADERRRPDDARRRPRLAPGRRGRRDPRRRTGRARHVGGMRAAARASQARARGRRRPRTSPASWPERSRPPAASSRASVTPCTGPSTHARSASSSSRTSVVSAGRMSRSRGASATRAARGLGQAVDDERRPGDRGRAARPRLPVVDRQGGPDPRPHRRAARASRRGARASLGLLLAAKAEEAITYEPRRATP